MSRSMMVIFMVCCLSVCGNLSAQTFSSGSSAAQGAFPPAAITGTYNTLTLDLKTAVVTATTGGTTVSTATLPGGAASGDAFPTGDIDFTTLTVPAGITLKFGLNSLNTPVTIRTTGDVTIAGTIDIRGGDGMAPSVITVPGKGNVGGSDGGRGGSPTSNTLGMPGLGRNGGGRSGNFGLGGAFPNANNMLVFLTGGSGGGGGSGQGSNAGGTGGGGGGGLLIASSTKIAVTGTIDASGGAGGGGFANCAVLGGGGGSGGAIRLMATRLELSGSLKANGGTGGNASNCVGGSGGGQGLIRVEAIDFAVAQTATISPSPSSGFPGFVRLANLPRLRISSIGGISVPDNPLGVGPVDIQIPSGANPMSIVVTGSNIPDGTTVTVSLKAPERDEVTATASTSTLNNIPTASVNMTVPSGLSYFQAYTATFNVSANIQQTLPLFNGEKIMQASVEFDGSQDHTYFYTASGKRVAAEVLMTMR